MSPRAGAAAGHAVPALAGVVNGRSSARLGIVGLAIGAVIVAVHHMVAKLRKPAEAG